MNAYLLPQCGFNSRPKTLIYQTFAAMQLKNGVAMKVWSHSIIKILPKPHRGDTWITYFFNFT